CVLDALPALRLRDDERDAVIARNAHPRGERDLVGTGTRFGSTGELRRCRRPADTEEQPSTRDGRRLQKDAPARQACTRHAPRWVRRYGIPGRLGSRAQGFRVHRLQGKTNWLPHRFKSVESWTRIQAVLLWRYEKNKQCSGVSFSCQIDRS